MGVISQIPLRNKVRDRIAEMLWDGTWASGDDLNEARLAEELGVSRTPLREGLLMLASEGLIEAKPNRGFHVPGVDPRAVAELYPVLGALEALAVRGLTGDFAKQAKALDRISGQLDRSGLSKAKRYGFDAAWHQELVQPCGNQTLLKELRVLWARSRSIDGALARGMADVENSSTEHHRIAEALATGDLAGAASQVEAHWTKGVDVVTRWSERT